MFPFTIFNVHVIAQLFFSSLAPPPHDSSLDCPSSYLFMMLPSIWFFIIHLNSSRCFLDLVIFYVALVVAPLFFKPILLHHYFCAIIHTTFHHVVHIVFHHYGHYVLHVAHHIWFCSSICHHHIIVITLIIIVFNFTIAMCIVTMLDSLIASLGVIHSCDFCFVALLNIILFYFPTSLTINALALVPWFFDKRLFEFVIVIYYDTRMKNWWVMVFIYFNFFGENLSWHDFQIYLFVVFMFVQVIYWWCRQFYLHHEKNHENWRKIGFCFAC